ncbi:MAG: alginate lyase family protein [Dehalococcoidia bacterium]|nr:alginate lyase family protein [Dehalococcoidia bacterium]
MRTMVFRLLSLLAGAALLVSCARPPTPVAAPTSNAAPAPPATPQPAVAPSPTQWPAPSPTPRPQPAPTPTPASAEAAARAVIRDPNASFFDVRARREYLRTTTDPRLLKSIPAARDCARLGRPEPPKGRMIIPPFYVSGGHGPANPAYAPAMQPYHAFEDRLSLLATLYARFGEESYVRCMVDTLRDWARANTLLDYDPAESSQAWYTVEWTASTAALSYSVIRADPAVAPADREIIEGWLGRVARRQIGFPGGRSACCNNHAWWRALEATSVGLVSNDVELFRWGMAKYYDALSRMADDGSWPEEMARYERALHYQNFSIAPLAMVAELADRQGVNLYDAKVNGRDIHRAVAFLLRALDDPAVVKAYASEEQDLRAFRPGSEDMAWMELYRRHYASPDLGRFLTEPINTRRFGGDVTLYVYRPAGQ